MIEKMPIQRAVGKDFRRERSPLFNPSMPMRSPLAFRVKIVFEQPDHNVKVLMSPEHHGPALDARLVPEARRKDLINVVVYVHGTVR